MNLPKDQKWAWKSVAGGFISFAMILSIDLSYSIIFKDVKNFYNVNSTIASSLFGFIIGFRLLLGPFVVIAIKLFDCDKVSIFGGALIGLGLFISSCAPNMAIFMIGYGAMVGIGLSFCFTSTLIVLSENFYKKKGLAFGIASSGVSIGLIIFPHVFALLIRHYEFRSALMIFSAFSLNIVVIGLLYRRPYFIAKNNNNTNNNNNTTEIHMEPETPSKKLKNLNSKPTSKIKLIIKDSFLNSKPWKNLNFLIFILGNSWFLVGLVPWTIFIVDFSNSIGEINLNIAVLTFTLEGISQFIARILSGVIFDIRHVRKIRGIICAVSCFFSALSCILLIVIPPSISSFLSISLFRGFSIGIFISQNVVILGDLCNPSFLSISIGIMSFMKGIGCLIGSFLSGVIRDSYKSYFETFIFLGANQFLAGLMILLATVRNSTRKSR